MAKAAGRHVPIERDAPARKDGELVNVAARLDDLARAQEDARGAANASEANYAVAFERLFVAVARLNPLHAASLIRALAQSSVTWSETAPKEARPSLRRT